MTYILNSFPIICIDSPIHEMAQAHTVIFTVANQVTCKATNIYIQNSICRLRNGVALFVYRINFVACRTQTFDQCKMNGIAQVIRLAECESFCMYK